MSSVAATLSCMTKSSPGPRDYTAGTERALFALSGMTCYFPDCPVPVVVFVNNEPVCNVQIGHIHGARRDSARYDPSMTDDERRAFANLILVCTPHHVVIDRLHPGDYPPELLRQWKSTREAEARIDRRALSSFSEDRLVELIEHAVWSGRPQRSITAELGLGVRMAAHLVTFPAATAREHFGSYAQHGPPVVILTVRNRGELQAYVDRHCIRITEPGLTIAANDFPIVNPRLPYPLQVGESQHWLYDLETVVRAVRATRHVQPGSAEALTGEVALGSGETIASSQMPANYVC